MSLRRFNPFASNASLSIHSNSVRSAQPPTYPSNATLAPTYATNAPGTPDAHDRNGSMRAWSSTSSSNTSTVAPLSSETVSLGETSGEITGPAGPRYSELKFHPYRDALNVPIFSVYYRVYAEDGAIPTANPVYCDDSYLGRILAQIVAPPQTAGSVKLCLSTFENVDPGITTILCLSLSSQSAMDFTSRLSILTHPGPGCTPHDPMALVVECSGKDHMPPRVKSKDPLPSRGAQMPSQMGYGKTFEGVIGMAYFTVKFL
jgi:hypothetical protein